jgi:hypothetical protein
MFLVWSALLLSLANSLPIGLQGGLSIAAVENFKDEALPQILKSIGEQELPPFSRTVGQKYIPVTVEVTEVVMKDLAVNTEDSRVIFTSPDKIEVELKSITGIAAFKWGVKVPSNNQEGVGSFSLKETKASIKIRLSAQDLRLRVTVEEASVFIGDVGILFAGNPSAHVANLVINTFKEELQGALSKQLNASFAVGFQAFLDDLFLEAPLIIALDEDLGVNYSLPLSPVVTPDYLEIYSLGVIVELAHPDSDPPISVHGALPHFNVTGDQIQVIVTEYTVNSGLYAGVNAGLVKFTVTAEDTPTLNTLILSKILPGIVKKYGVKPCKLECSAQEYPAVNFIPGTIQGLATFMCAIEVAEVQEPAAQVDITIDFTGSMEIEDWTLKSSIDDIQISALEVIATASGIQCDAATIQTYLNSILEYTFSTIGEALFGGGLELPTMKGVDMRRSSVTVQEKYLLVETTPEYSFIN